MPRGSFDGGGKTLLGPGREIRAAQYVRMSTDHQRYSIQNQSDAIAQYAAAHGLTVVRTYSDEGKSGLSLDRRDALKQLLDDVQNGRADFSTILVYDVSRWGRFQDSDESAYNEYLCKQAGTSVRYCAEQFENDGSLSSAIIKSMKRAMAGEYSRELSVKVFAGQCRLVGLGFHLGGPPGYGLRRMLIDEHGIPKCELKAGQRKNLQTDRVILMPGPVHEVETVIEIFRLFVTEGFRQKKIATTLNNKGVLTHQGHPWLRCHIHKILISEKYVGTAVFNRTSAKCGRRRTRNDPGQWVRRENAFPAIVPPDLFWAAQSLIAQRRQDYSDEGLIKELASILSKKGKLSRTDIKEFENSPCANTYRYRFGSILNAYDLAGYEPSRNFIYSRSRDFFHQTSAAVLADIISSIEEMGCTVETLNKPRSIIINGEVTLSVTALHCQKKPYGDGHWSLRFARNARPDITVAVRMAPCNRQILDYFILPRVDPGWVGAKVRKRNNGFSLDQYRFDSLAPLFELVARRNVRRAG